MKTWVNWKSRKLDSTNGRAQATTTAARTTARRRPAPVICSGVRDAGMYRGWPAPSARRSYAVHGGAPEEAARLHDEDDQDHGEGDGELELGPDEPHVRPHEVLEDADDEAAEDRAAGAREAPERGRGEGVDEDPPHHVRIEEHHGRYHHAGHGADERGEAPADAEHPADADAAEPARDRVLRGGAHGEAERRVPEEDVERQEDDQRDAEGAEVVSAEEDVADPDGLLRERARKGLLDVRVDPAGDAVQDHEEPDADDDDREHRRVLDGPDHDALDREPADEGDRQRGGERHPVREPRVDQRPGEVGAEHRHLALRVVHDVGRLVDHDEGEREAPVDAARRETRDHLLDEDVHGLSTRGTSAGWRRPSGGSRRAPT